MSDTVAALISGSKLSVTSHLSILADAEPEVVVWVNSFVWGCRWRKASCSPSACCRGSKPC